MTQPLVQLAPDLWRLCQPEVSPPTQNVGPQAVHHALSDATAQTQVCERFFDPASHAAGRGHEDMSCQYTFLKRDGPTSIEETDVAQSRKGGRDGAKSLDCHAYP